MTMAQPNVISPPEIERPAAARPPATNAPACDIRIVTTAADFDALENGWNDLLAQSDATVFQTFEWQRTWWKYFAKPNQELSIRVFTIDGNVAAIAPLFKERAGMPGIRFFSRLQFIGSGLSDYADIIIRRGREEAVLSSFASHLRETQKNWDVFDCQDVNESSAVMRFLPEIMERHGLTFSTYQGNVCPQVRLQSPAGASPTGSYNFRRKFKKLQQEHAADVRCVRSEGDALLSALDAFAVVHGSRWKSLGHSSAFDDENMRAFHLEVATKFARRDWLRLYILTADGVPAAAGFHFNYAGKIYMYQANAHGTEAVMKCSPGYVVRTLAIADGISEGMEIFDFLRGDEQYKYTDGNPVESKNYLLRTKSPSSRSRLAFVVFLAYDLADKSYHRLIREYYDYRRFNVLEQRSLEEKMLYCGRKSAELFTLAYHFALRHSSIKSPGEQ